MGDVYMNYDENEIQQLLTEMTEALQEAHEAQERYSAKLDELEKENLFLSETITQNKLGLITTERRDLLRKVMQTESDASKALEEAQSIRSEYYTKLDKISVMIKDVMHKENNLDQCIDEESDKKIADQKQLLNNNYKKEKARLQHEYSKLEADIKHKLKIRTIIAAVGAGVAIISILLTVFA